MIDRMRTFLLAPALVALVLAAAGCVTPEDRQPAEDVRVAPDFAATPLRDVAVLPVVNRDPRDAMPDEDATLTFPEAAAREQMRRFLIRTRDYAVPTSAWVDERGGVDLDTDATLRLEIDDWDTGRLLARGVIYATGAFVLAKAPEGAELWRFSFRDLRLEPAAPHGGFAAERNMIESAELLVREGLMRVPGKR